MTYKLVVAVVALAASTVVATLPADAAKRKTQPSNTQPIYYDASGRQIEMGRRAPTRLTVRGRSYLNPGTETKQLAEHYADYAYPPGGSVSYRNRNDLALTWNRTPLPDPFDIPGWPKF